MINEQKLIDRVNEIGKDLASPDIEVKTFNEAVEISLGLAINNIINLSLEYPTEKECEIILTKV
jgi:hypothetical protein